MAILCCYGRYLLSKHKLLARVDHLLTVVVDGVGQVELEALDGSLAGVGCLAGIAQHGKHGQPSVADLQSRSTSFFL